MTTTKKNTSLIWRLSKLPTVEELRELVKDKIITQEEAKEVLFDEESFIPEGDRGERSLQSEIKFLRELVEKLSKSKSEITTIIREVENYKDNLEYLNQKEKVLIEKFRNDGKLPEKIDSYLLSSLSNLFNNIEEVELSGRKLEEILFSEGEILDYSQFLERLERIKRIVSYDKDTDNIRIKKAKESKI